MSTPSTFRLIVLSSREQTTIYDARLSSDQPRPREAPATNGERTPRGKLSLVAAKTITKPSPNTSVFQKVNHLFLKDKITKQSWVNMNDHKKPWFLTERKPISRSGGLIFFLSHFKAIFFKLTTCLLLRMALYGIANQRSTSSFSGQNDGWKKR